MTQIFSYNVKMHPKTDGLAYIQIFDQNNNSLKVYDRVSLSGVSAFLGMMIYISSGIVFYDSSNEKIVLQGNATPIV